MLFPGILGLKTVLFLLVMVVFIEIRRKLKNAAAKKEEIIRLVAMASEEAAMAEIDATVSPVPIPKPHQCAVCFCPTTMRCSRCKVVRYCSGKCQIIHWRQGHQDECHPPINGMQFKEESEFREEAESQFNNDFEMEDKPNIISEALYNVDDDGKLKASTSGHGIEIDVATSCKNGEGNLDFGTFNRSGKPSSVSTAPNIVRTTVSINEMEVKKSSSNPERSNMVNTVDRESCINKMQSNPVDEKMESMSQAPKTKTLKPDNVMLASSGSKKQTKGITPEGKLDVAKSRSLPSNDGKNDSRKSTNELDSFSPSRSSGDHLFSTYGGHFVASSKSAKTDGNHALPEKNGSIPSLSNNAQNGLKTSMQKVVQQFKPSKQSKCHISGLGSDIAGNYKVIFPYELFVILYSHKLMVLGAFGLVNCGNSCYANAVLQCLAFTRPLTSYLLRGIHSKACQKKEWCFVCEFEYIVHKAREGKSPLSPIRILSKIHKIGSHLSHGKEEDAHEFLRYAVDTMQSVFLNEANAKGPLAEETTLVGMTFGGYLRSKIKCMKCLGKSEQCERMMDLTVEIDGQIGTLEEALVQYTGTETLDGDNKYLCGRCKSYEKAKKKLTILEAPNILTIVLKRFQSGNFEKLNKPVRFPEVLNMAPYMSGTSDRSPLYSLYAVVVHLDVRNASFSGHYVCYVKNILGEWFKIDDSKVERVELKRVLSEGAYMLLYARDNPRPPTLLGSNMVTPVAKFRRRNFEAVPSSVAKSKSRSNPNSTIADCSFAQHKSCKNPYSGTSSGVASKPPLDPYDWRFNSLHRLAAMDSSSESSSLFSCSDASSCSTVSTKDSSSTEDFSDYIWGDTGTNWYRRYQHSTDMISSSHSNFDVDVKGHNGWRDDSKGEGNFAVLHTETTKHRRKSTSEFDKSSRETDLGEVFWGNSFDVRSGTSFRKSNVETPAHNFF